MEYQKLGKTDITISKVCVGCMSFGQRFEDFHMWTLDREATDEMVKKALDLGINFFDTANTYSHGTSEEYLGKALKRYAKRENAKENDLQIIARVKELADKYNRKMSEIALAWLLKKDAVTLLVGATKPTYLDDAVNALTLDLTEEDVKYLEELYLPHKIVGAI